MRTKISLVSGIEAWLICGLIILIATLGKFGGTFIAARITGYNRDSAALGALMNTRGLMELIVLNVAFIGEAMMLGESVTFLVRDDFRFFPFHHCDHGVRGAEIDTDNFFALSHD